ncbi:MAG: TetR-like C-terminal domain-containing protein [Emergencia sp.]
MSSLTERALAASLKKLLEKKTLDKITVKDITDDCGVNRQTFYYHFHDVYDLIEWIFSDLARQFTESCMEGNDWKEGMQILIEAMMKNKAFIINTFYSINRRQLDTFLQNQARPSLSVIARSYAEGMIIDEEDFDFVVDVFTFGLVGILTQWVSNGMDEEFVQKLSRFYLLVDGTMEGTLEKFAKNPKQ